MKTRHLLTSALALIMMTACSDSTGVETSDLEGTWTALSMVVSSVADPTMTIDLIEEGSAVTLVFGEDGTYSVTFTGEGEEDDETGTFTVSGNVLTLVETFEGQVEEPEEIAIVLSGSTMTLTLSEMWYFGQSEVEEAAVLVIGLVRQTLAS